MKNRKPVPRSFRAWPENEERLEFARSLGIDVSELVNEVMQISLKPVLEKKARKIREAAAAPVP